MLLNCVNRFKSVLSKKLVRSKSRSSVRSTPRGVEVLESRELLATFLVTNLRNYGAGSFRQAIIESNQRPGADTIDFDVAGTILNCETSLPAITDTVTIDGSTAPSFAGSPVVTLDFQGTSGLRFAIGSDGSILRDLSLVNAGNAGVTLSASDITVQGNYIGLLADGKTIAGNSGDGVRINASSHDDLIGQSNAISYYNADAVSMQPVSAWQGIRNSDTSGVYLNYPGVDPSTAITGDNSVAGNQVVGIVGGGTSVFSYQATINGFQLSNVISGNHGNGIGIYGADDNQIAMNFIGTDASGTLALGNAKNGILVTNGAAGNIIGGQSTGGNDPTAGVFVRPPQGNLISGNRGDGVLINNGATQTLLSGNFVGTSASGNSALGNRLDGVAIVNANGNQLIGCTVQQNPFVFYNVLSGNGGNGLRVTNSNNTTVQANFMGVGADNATIVANGGDGLLVSGSSKNTQVGGVIPLGNVVSGNDRNGIEVRDTASGFTSFNTFDGIFAFAGAAPNRLDGTLITSSGGNNLIRTCIVSGNLGNGIELGGNATGVQVTDTAVGTDTNIQTEIPNQGSGILISGNAHDNAIGGFQPSVEPQVTISANRGYGIEIVGSAHNNIVYHTYIGTNAQGTADLGNALGGIYLGPGTSSNTIGGGSTELQNRILYSGGPGVTIRSSSRNAVLGNEIRNTAGAGVVVIAGRHNVIGSATAGNTIMANGQDGLDISGIVTGTRVQNNEINSNAGNGVMLDQAQGVTIGGSLPATGNGIVGNQGYGLLAYGLCAGSLVQNNVIVANAKGNVNLTNSRGITYIP